MKIRPLAIEGAYEITPNQHVDERGVFLEWYRCERLTAELGYPLRLAQANTSVSQAGVVRGLHFADVPPGQAKYVTCVRGAVLDVVVDLRVDSPTFGQWDSVRLDATDRRCVYVGEGLGHGFCALTDAATLTYLCSQPYAPEREHIVHALDPDLAIQWPMPRPSLSGRDAAAPSLRQARERGLLPTSKACHDYTRWLRERERRDGMRTG